MQTGARNPSDIPVLANPQPILNDPTDFSQRCVPISLTLGNYMGWRLVATRHLTIGFGVGKLHTTDLEYQRTVTKNHERFSHDDRKRLKSVFVVFDHQKPEKRPESRSGIY